MARLGRNDWLQAAAEILAVGAVADVKVEPLAKRLGVTKGSFYHHFDDRAALLRGLVEFWVRADTERVIDMIETDDRPDPVERLRKLVQLTIGHRTELDGLEAAIREWAAHDPEVAEVSRRVDDLRIGYVTGLLAEAGIDRNEAERRAHLLYRVVIGEHTWRRYGGPQLDLGVADRLITHLLAGEAGASAGAVSGDASRLPTEPPAGTT